MQDSFKRKISAGASAVVCIGVEPSLCYCHEIRYHKYLCSERLPPVLNIFFPKSCAIYFMCLLRLVAFFLFM